MNRKQFILSHGATCANWTWSWSFINQKAKVVIFGAWDTHTESDRSLIFSEEWQENYQGKRPPGYGQSREHIRLVEEDGYQLQTFPLQFSDAMQDKDGYGPSRIKGFTPKLTSAMLSRVGNDWYASSGVATSLLPEEVGNPSHYYEGASKTISVNIYERNAEARAKCISHYGYGCSACGFDFEKQYGSLGERFIHVHHLVSLSSIGRQYKLNPIRDLRPLCPNCHAIVHRTRPALTIEALQKQLAAQRKKSKG